MSWEVIIPFLRPIEGLIRDPDISDILARKKEGRREISRRSLGEKIAMVEAMRERLAPLKRIREERRANRKSAASS